MCLRGEGDIYALALRRGHGFGRRPPVEAWQSDDALSSGDVRKDIYTDEVSIMVVRRRVDYIWCPVVQVQSASTIDEARLSLSRLLSDRSPEPLPSPQHLDPVYMNQAEGKR